MVAEPTGDESPGAGSRADRTGLSLIAALCAGALAPVVAAAGGIVGPVALAGIGVVGSVGANVLTDVIGAAIARLRGVGRAGDPLEPAAVERALTVGIEAALRGSAGAALREAVAGILRESGALRSALDDADADAAVALAGALQEVGDQFTEFAFLATDLRTAVRSLDDELARSAAERRAGAERSRLQSLVLGRVLDAVEGRTGSGAEPVWVGCPYPGLAPFGVEDARVFHGRRDLTRRLVVEVVERTHGGGPLVVLGASGAGKSSLLRAGLIPAIARGELGPDHWTCRVITPTTRPRQELAAHLADLSGRPARQIAHILSVNPGRAADFMSRPCSSRAVDNLSGRAGVYHHVTVESRRG